MASTVKGPRGPEFEAARELRRRVEAVCRAARLERGETQARGRTPRAQAIRDRVLRWRGSLPEGPRAHKLLYLALRSGRISRPERCEGCRRPGLRLHAHHADYSRPLAVQWLCCSCHRLEHRRLAERARSRAG